MKNKSIKRSPQIEKNNGKNLLLRLFFIQKSTNLITLKDKHCIIKSAKKKSFKLMIKICKSKLKIRKVNILKVTQHILLKDL